MKEEVPHRGRLPGTMDRRRRLPHRRRHRRDPAQHRGRARAGPACRHSCRQGCCRSISSGRSRPLLSRPLRGAGSGARRATTWRRVARAEGQSRSKNSYLFCAVRALALDYRRCRPPALKQPSAVQAPTPCTSSPAPAGRRSTSAYSAPTIGFSARPTASIFSFISGRC